MWLPRQSVLGRGVSSEYKSTNRNGSYWIHWRWRSRRVQIGLTQTSPPKQASISMYTNLLSRYVLYNLDMKKNTQCQNELSNDTVREVREKERVRERVREREEKETEKEREGGKGDGKSGRGGRAGARGVCWGNETRDCFDMAPGDDREFLFFFSLFFFVLKWINAWLLPIVQVAIC